MSSVEFSMVLHSRMSVLEAAMRFAQIAQTASDLRVMCHLVASPMGLHMVAQAIAGQEGALADGAHPVDSLMMPIPVAQSHSASPGVRRWHHVSSD